MSARRQLVGLGLVIVISYVTCLAVLAAASKRESKSKSPTTGKAASPATTQADAKRRPVPSPDLTPGQVVRIVMDALKNNDAKDGGIAVAFDFASPSNKKITGPLPRFIPMVKNPMYAPMINHKSATLSKVMVRDDEAQVVVTLVDAKGEEAAYVFRLSKQPPDGEPADCWMTDGVIRVDPRELPAEPKLKDPIEEDKPDRA